MAFLKVSLVLLYFLISVSTQSEDTFETPKPLWTTFHHPIRRVAVVGAGPAGLQAAAKLIEHNFTVRLLSVHRIRGQLASQRRDSGQTDEIPAQLPATRYYNEGDDGLRLDYRWTEHWQPRPIWDSLHINTPKISTELPDVRYDPDTPWVVSNHAVQRHVRSYASHHCLNSNDHCPTTASAPPVTSYSTRVEKLEKNAEAHTWVLTLRRLERLHESHRSWPNGGRRRLMRWFSPLAHTRRPTFPTFDGIPASGRYANKTVLIVGGSVSASEIARDLRSFAHRIIASVRPANNSLRQLDLSRFPNITEFRTRNRVFGTSQWTPQRHPQRKNPSYQCSVLWGIDEIILATGYRGYALFPPNSTTERPENIHWTGHYIPDPTLAYTFGRPWTLGRYQSYGLAKVWEGSARLPTSEQMKLELEEEYWREWLGEAVFRRYITWLNNASLEHGGRFVEPPPIENIEVLKYYMFVYLLNNTMNRDNIGHFDISMLAGQLGDKDPWDALVNEDDNW
ncbi:FAD/NAD-P-binding domain-containing protein [Mycena leptocephala]|nr:FAD/NAD-P-binding domain-containing protein [Mycena leptocephala]